MSMKITQNELNLASICVNAAIFIFGQRSIRKQIDTQSRSNQMASDRATKRDAYAGFIASIEEFLEAKKSQNTVRELEAEKSMNIELALIDLIAPKSVYLVAANVGDYADLPRTDAKRDKFLKELYSAMRLDLNVNDPIYELNPAKKN